MGEREVNEVEKTPSPGSQEALNLGCLCAVIDNCYGRGYRFMKGVYVMVAECPLHGDNDGSDARS